MYCSKCGAKNEETATFCASCGNNLGLETSQESGSATPSPAVVELWNPNAAANWSLLFTPIFGSFINKKNWIALGEEKRAKTSTVWFWISIAMLVVVLILPAEAARGVGFFYLIIWYFSAGRRQAKFVKEKLGENYQKRGWAGPIFAGIGLLLLVSILFGIIAGPVDA